MRKIFSIFGMVLVSLAMQATVVTQDFPLSGFESYSTASVSNGVITEAGAWSGAQLWQETQASEFDQVVLTVADHAEKVLFKVIYSDNSAAQVELPVGTNLAAIDITQDIISSVQVINWSESTGVSITITNACLRGAIGNRKNVTIWSGTKTFDEFDWEHRLLMSAEEFADLHVGDILEVYYTTDAHDFHQFDVNTNYDNKYPSFAPAQINLSGSNESGVLRFYIAESTDLSNIAAQSGLYLNGKYITFTKVSVIKHEVLWTGSQVVDNNWSGYQSIASSKLSDLAVGNILCVRVTNIDRTQENTPVVSLFCGWNEADALADGAYEFVVDDESPMIVEFPVTYKLEQQLRGKELLVRGANYTMTDIYVLEGSPVNTVAAYLNVSDAGMATLVVPFDVPSLPAGVEAYELTNNGDETIWATEVNALEADKPVLIVAAAGEYEFVSEAGASDDISAKTGTYANGALVGTYAAIDPLAQTTDANYNYILSVKNESVGFYQVLDNSCSVAPYRAYLSCGHNANEGGAGAAPKKMRLVFPKDAPTGVENGGVLNGANGVQKILRNGQLFILRNGVEYNVNGQMTK